MVLSFLLCCSPLEMLCQALFGTLNLLRLFTQASSLGPGPVTAPTAASPASHAAPAEGEIQPQHLLATLQHLLASQQASPFCQQPPLNPDQHQQLQAMLAQVTQQQQQPACDISVISIPLQPVPLPQGMSSLPDPVMPDALSPADPNAWGLGSMSTDNR